MAGIEIPILISGASDAISLLGRLSEGLLDAATRFAALADEQARLDTASRDLGLNFDAAAASAGRFVDETEAMGVANRFAAADIRLTQQQLNDVMRVAGASADMLGTDTAGAVNTLREALIRGREGGLERFGQGLASVAGDSHTVESRFLALHARALEMAQATDTATDRLNRFKDSLEDATRTFASSFVQEITRLESVGQGFSDATDDAEEFNRTLQAVGSTAAYMTAQVVLRVTSIAGLIGTVVGGLTGMVQLAAAATHGLAAFNAERDRLQREGLAAQSAAMAQDALDRLAALDAENEQRTTAAVASPVVPSAAPTRPPLSRPTRGGSTPSAQDLRAQAEALRLAREANDNAGRAVTFEEQLASAALRLASATREVALAEASRHDHTRRLTAALQAQTEVLNAQHALYVAHDEAYRAGQAAVTELIAAETHRVQVLEDAQKFDAAKIRNGEILLRQETLAATVRQRAREDAVAAAAAFAGDGETAAERAGISTGESARAAMATEEANATRELARATQDLAQARREESDASISTEDRTTHVTEALARQTTALQRQRAAQAASNAEIQRIRTDRTDALAASAKGLGDGLVSAGLAAAFAGENIGAALQKQLAASLQALAIESAQKALYSLATGFFYLATGNPAAVPAFTSAAIFGAVAVGAGAVSAAIAPSAAPAAAGGGAGERASGVSPGGAGGMGGGSSAGPIVNNYYAPIVGGRQSTDAETGVRIDRYNDAARARLRRAA
jgi:hypothetical protein